MTNSEPIQRGGSHEGFAAHQKRSRVARRIVCLIVGCLVTVVRVAGAEEKFDFDALRARAKALAAKPYIAPVRETPEWLQKLTYDEHRIIQFDETHTLWRKEKLPFQVQFFHPGWYFNQPVRINQVIDGRAELVPFRRDYFQYHQLKIGDVPPTLGFAGFRLLYPLNDPNRPQDETGAFLGASYFRMLCKGAHWGLSARGLALNTGEPAPEEFPVFTEFWLEQPKPNAKEMTVYALLDSDSVAGAYQFTLAPGRETIMQVKSAIFARKNVKVFGVAPLTGMFWRGENSNTPSEDFRPEVHDSDGLLMHTGTGEWIWRPLQNPRGVRVVTFSDENPQGFGFLQRDRNFENYQDTEARYDARPSAWVEPVGKWGRGTIRLVEIPSGDEFTDNMVAFWTPEKLPAPGEPIEVSYRLHWLMEQTRPPGGFVHATRHGKSLAQEKERDLHRFVVDFDGANLQALPAEASIEHVLTASDGAKIVHSTLLKNPVNGRWRVAFALKSDGSGRPVELRCFLKQPPHTLTETWSYLWQP
jgi:periplasmic glucans biosynthesis protein